MFGVTPNHISYHQVLETCLEAQLLHRLYRGLARKLSQGEGVQG